VEIVTLQPAEFSAGLFQQYTLEWRRKEGDSLKKGDQLAIVYGTETGDQNGLEALPTRQYYSSVKASVDGILRCILIPKLTFTTLDSAVELAVLSSFPKTLSSIKIFYSHVNEDEQLRQMLEKHLSVLKQTGVIEEWHKGGIAAGQEWQMQVNSHLDDAHIILVLLSSDFMYSEQCSLEMQRAIQRHKADETKVVLVLLRPFDWEVLSLAELQMLPTNKKPITSWANYDEAFRDIAQGIREIVQEMIESHLRHVQDARSQQKEQYNSLKCQKLSLTEKIDRYNKEEKELSKEILLTQMEQKTLFAYENSLRAAIEHYEIFKQTPSIWMLVFKKIREDIKDIRLRSRGLKTVDMTPVFKTQILLANLPKQQKKIINKIKQLIYIAENRLKPYDELKKKKADVESILEKLSKQLEKIELIISISSEEDTTLLEQEKKITKLLSKIKNEKRP
jgi:hypothetical protein